MKRIFLSVAVAAALVSCSSSSSGKVEKMTNEMCSCFNKINDSLPPESLKLFNDVATADNAGEAYMNGLKQIPEAVLLKMNAALMMVAKPGTAVKTCLEDMDKKYKSIGGEKVEITRKMVDVLKKRKDSECNLMLALMRIELEKQEKGKK